MILSVVSWRMSWRISRHRQIMSAADRSAVTISGEEIARRNVGDLQAVHLAQGISRRCRITRGGEALHSEAVLSAGGFSAVEDPSASAALSMGAARSADLGVGRSLDSANLHGGFLPRPSRIVRGGSSLSRTHMGCGSLPRRSLSCHKPMGISVKSYNSLLNTLGADQCSSLRSDTIGLSSERLANH